MEPKFAEQEMPQTKGKYYKNRNQTNNTGYSKSTYKTKFEQPQFSEQNEDQSEQSYVTYKNYEYTYDNYNNYNNYNQGYYNYRPRGRGYFPSRGAPRGRGRSGYYRNYYNDNYTDANVYEREVNYDEVAKPQDGQTHGRTTETKTQEPSSEFCQQKNLNLQEEEENNILNAKDIPSNIRSNIKNLIEESETEVRGAESEHVGERSAEKQFEKERCSDKHHHHKQEEMVEKTHVNSKKEHHPQTEEKTHPTSHSSHVSQTTSHIPHSSQSQGVFTITNTSNVPNSNIKSHQNKFEEFAVSSSSLSIDQAKTNLPKQTTNNSNILSSVQTSESSINAPFRDTRDQKKMTVTAGNGVNPQNVKNIKKEGTGSNPNMGAMTMPSGTGQNMMPQNMGMPMMPQGMPQSGEYQQGYAPWMSPMGFYYPQPQPGMQSYDPNTPSPYPMMPMYYLPQQGYYQQEEDGQQKKRAVRSLETPQQFPGQNVQNVRIN